MSSIKLSRQVAGQMFGKDMRVTDAHYVAFIRRFPPSKLVSLNGSVAPNYSFGQLDLLANSRITPWSLADVARVSLVFGNEYRAATPTMAG